MDNTAKAQHTPGPWHAGDRDISSLIIYDAEGWAVADAKVFHSRQPRAQGVANARLIAAAPELLEAADNALGVLLGCCVPAGGIDDRSAMLDAQRQLRAALVKATGSAV